MITGSVTHTAWVEQHCHDPGLTGSDPDPASSDLTLDEVKSRVRENFYIREYYA
jgi:hypothetical protein